MRRWIMSAETSQLGFFRANVGKGEIQQILEGLKVKYQPQKEALALELEENTKIKAESLKAGIENIGELGSIANIYVRARELGVIETEEDVKIKAEQRQEFWAAIHACHQINKSAQENIANIERDLETVENIIAKLESLEQTLGQKTAAELKAIKEVMQNIQDIEFLQTTMEDEVDTASLEKILEDMMQLKTKIEALQNIYTDSDLIEVINAFKKIYDAESENRNSTIEYLG